MRSTTETGVEERREVVERILRRPVGAEHHVLGSGDVLGQPAVIGLPAHDVDVGVRDGCRVEAAPLSALQADGKRRATLDDDGGRRKATERREERRAVGAVAERRVDQGVAATREAAELLVGAAVEAWTVCG